MSLAPFKSPTTFPLTASRILLSYYLTNGLSAALGLLMISGAIQYFIGNVAAAAASVGVIVCIPPDQAAPRQGKIWQLLPAALIGLPLFTAVQFWHNSPWILGALLIPSTFLAFLGAAWGKRGLPISVSAMFAMIFSMATPQAANVNLLVDNCLYFALGAGLYLGYATLANSLLNQRYRVQILADTLLLLAKLLHTQAQQFAANAELALHGQILQQQTALADQLQTARDLVLENPNTLKRQRLAGMLIQALEIRDHLLVCELDLELFKQNHDHQPLLVELQRLLIITATELQQQADALLLKHIPNVIHSHREHLAAQPWADTNTSKLLRGLAGRISLIRDETAKLSRIARSELAPDVELIHSAWRLFVSPLAWSWRPLINHWHWQAPPLRHALRAAAAIGFAYGLSLILPWKAHAYWILLTIVVVLRGSLAQTLERRNSRVLGTLLGCLLAGAIIYTHPSAIGLLVLITIAQALAHGFSAKRYLVTAISATVLGLVQAHMLNLAANPVVDVLERLADTLIGAAIAWPFSYLFPSWERSQIPKLIKRSLSAQAQHAQLALGMVQSTTNPAAELDWRLARREAYNSLSALVQATERAIAEPRAVQPPLALLEQLIAQSYQLLAQLTAAKTLISLRRERLDMMQIGEALRNTSDKIHVHLVGEKCREKSIDYLNDELLMLNMLSDPFAEDLSPWLLRRLNLAERIAVELRLCADKLLADEQSV